MKRIILLALVLMVALALYSQPVSIFGNLRHSSRDAEGNLHIRYEALDSQFGQYELFYRTGGDWFAAHPSQEGSYFESLVPYEWGQNLQYRLKGTGSYMGESVSYLHTAIQDNDSFPPTLTRLAEMGQDATGDSMMIYAPALDLTYAYVGSTDQKLHRAIKNVSGTFPTMVSLTSFNLYMTTIANPFAVMDSVVYAMVYTFSIPGVISPGLYKIGIDESMQPTFTRLGNIQSQVSGGTLFLSCDWGDLVSDPQFGAWPNEYNSLAFADITMRISLDMGTMQPDFQLADTGVAAVVSFEELSYNVMQNTVPELELISWDVPGHLLELRYTDAEGDFPLEALLGVSITEESFIYMDLEPVYNPDGSISIIALVGNESNWVVSVSDNGIDYAYYSHSVSADDPLAPALSPLAFSVTNPLSRSLDVAKIKLSGLNREPLSISLYNLRGQKVLQLAEMHPTTEEFTLDWQSGAQLRNLGSGLYFFKVEQGGRQIRRKIIVVR